jgi:hypothetical protein
MKVMEWLNLSLTVIFTVEAIVKIIATGFISNNFQHINPYMRSMWNVIDFFVVIC